MDACEATHSPEYRHEVITSAVGFRPVSESSGGPLLTLSTHPSFVRYPIPGQEAGNTLMSSSRVASVRGWP
ncbi:hypothetical protein EVAR_32817_1 [Eumeta japonica]|uniref:Uncharacterized protein n=1 Tax=Eumeta variegata TaxID=151549 RepID=A0A4C1WAK3_EUMVA|nr:hypothetical protein EVAR_32817_1 [Eumeta japonica]